ncbi:MAG: hypothetical protein R6X27_12705 [Candidatus Desulfacyla sp.]
MKKLFVLGMAALLLVAFSVPAMADVKIGGIIFTDFYYINRDKDNMFNPQRGQGSYSNTAIQVPNITRLYGRWTNEDNVGMYIEFGLGQGGGGIDASSSDDQNSAVVRHAYGWWDVNPMFQIMAGHSTTPFSPLNPNQLLGTRSGSVNIIGVGYGDYYAGRFAQVRGTFKFGKVAKLEIALVDPNGAQSAGGQFYPTPYSANNTLIPRVDISVPLYLGPVHLYPGFLWQRRGVDTVVGSTVDDNITTWIGTIGGKFGMGPFALSGEFNYGENWGNTRGLAGYSMPARMSSASLKSDNNINNAETWSWWVDLSYKFGPIAPSLIFGMMDTKNKVSGTDVGIESQSMMYGVSVPIDLAKGFRIRPELMWYDDGKLKTDNLGDDNLGKYLIAGVQFQITF